uniref:K Homology domain-containing protein n=1 Tax=Anopheles epiroticus TaxID=199890 RepID=A0A182P3Q7_9DIPT
MDVMSPQLMWIGTRCYRVNHAKTMTMEEQSSDQPQGYVEEDLYGEDDREEEYEIELTDKGKFQTAFHVPAAFYAMIIGAKGQTRQRLEAETKAQIRVPKQGTTGDIVVTGSSRKSVAAARSRIELIVIGARNKQQFTHFLSVPLNVPDVMKRFAEFRHKIVHKLPVAFSVDESLFQQPEKLHITLCTMSLMDNEDRANAAQILLDCQESIISPILKENGPLDVRVRGLEYMNDDPHAVDVLYGKIESPALQTAADQIYEYFIAKGLMQKKYEHVKLHVTLINSLFRVSQSEIVDEKAAERKRITFDASEILRLYGEYDFGSVVLNEIHLSQRFSTSCTGYYEATAVLKLIIEGGQFRKSTRCDGKVILITGANTGIGKETARELLKRGGKVYIACRSLERGNEARSDIIAQTGLGDIHVRELDLASLESIRKFAKGFLEEEKRLDILINNAGVMACPKALTNDGFEQQLGVNHLGHFLLTNLLLDRLKASAPSRIINLSSLAHKYGKINQKDLNSEHSYNQVTAYCQSKLANVMFTRELAKRLQGTSVTAYAVHPGTVDTDLPRHMGSLFFLFDHKLIKPLLRITFKTPLSGAQTTLYTALDEDLTEESGKYYAEQKLSKYARNDEIATWLWDESARMTGLSG